MLQNLPNFLKHPQNHAEDHQKKLSKNSDQSIHVIKSNFPSESILKNNFSTDRLQTGNNYSLKDRNLSSTTDFLSTKKRIFTGIRDPGQRPLCDKSACFEKNFSELPESRLKLVLNKKVLKIKKSAVQSASQQFFNENLAKIEKNQSLTDFRIKALQRLENQRQKISDLQAKSGLIKYRPMPKISKSSISSRIQSLSMPKTLKNENFDQYLKNFGLNERESIKSENFESTQTIKNPSFNFVKEYNSIEKNKTIRTERKKDSIVSEKEIEKSMKEINEFHQRYGELKGRVGFPQIYLEKFKNYSKY